LIEVRCPKCNKKLGMFDGKAEIKCPRCRTITKVNTEKSVLNATE